MVEPDPWNVIEKNHQESTQNCVVATNLPNIASNQANPSAFEDNFLSNDSSVTEKLPDSSEYIQALGIVKATFRNLIIEIVVFSFFSFCLDSFHSFELHT